MKQKENTVDIDAVAAVIGCISKHAIQIYHACYDNAEELFQYTDAQVYPPEIAKLAEAFGMMAVKLEAREMKLNQTIEELILQEAEIQNLWQSFVETMVAALDARDPTTCGHSTRIAGYAKKLAEAMNQDGYFSRQGLNCSAAFIRELYYSALLHDIGKIGVKEDVLLKQQRLSPERMESIRHKFNCYYQYVELQSLRQGLVVNLEAIQDIHAYYPFVARINIANVITAAEETKIKEIAKLHFIDPDGNSVVLLDDLEVKNLTIREGNLNFAEKQNMNSHVRYTCEILQKMPWMPGLKGVPYFAASHHEKLDGSGYPQGLKESEIPIQARILTILDIFDALIARDRPYKPPVPVTRALAILEQDVAAGRLDREIFGIFVNYEVYKLYQTGDGA